MKSPATRSQRARLALRALDSISVALFGRSRERSHDDDDDDDDLPRPNATALILTGLTISTLA